MILQPSNDNNLIAYADADWANDINSRKSTSEYIIQYRDSIISWSTRKQSCVALSSTEAEYISLTSALTECIWIKSLLEEMSDEIKITLYEDNQACIKLLADAKREIGLKHTEVKVHFIKEKIEEQHCEIRYVPTEEQIADISTKPLAAVRFCKLRA
ncbi:hypothetical protein Trydic_g1712 [Trypoxylus dichotomus]